MSDLESALEWQLRALKINGYEREHRAFDERRWRLDFAWPDRKIGVEIQGGTRGFYQMQKDKAGIPRRVRVPAGRHQTPDGFEKDCEKHNAHTQAGWRIFLFTAKMVRNGTAIKQIADTLG